jgi:uncharacterized protein YjbI with pentapeptide repeats
MAEFFADKEFKNINSLEKGEYDNCRFIQCNFEGAHLATIAFTDCKFEDCNLTNAQLNETSLHDVAFTNCKLVGIHFFKYGGFTFSVSFDHCQLNLASFYGMNLANTKFSDCNLQEVDFTEANLSGLTLHNCDLGRAVFSDTNLEKADLRTAFNFSIDPEYNQLKKAKFSLQNVSGLLQKYGVVLE